MPGTKKSVENRKRSRAIATSFLSNGTDPRRQNLGLLLHKKKIVRRIVLETIRNLYRLYYQRPNYGWKKFLRVQTTMEASGVVFRRIPCVSGAGVGTQGHPSSSSSLKIGALPFPRKVKLNNSLNYDGYKDRGHLDYYNWSPSCGPKKEIKKKLKMLKGLSKDLSMFSGLGLGTDPESGLAGEVQGKIITEATEVLLKQLEQLRAEEKELKRKRKQEKAKLKAERKQTKLACESLSSSESSDSECGEVIDMNRLRTEVSMVIDAEQMLAESESRPVIPDSTTSTILPILRTQEATLSKESGSEDRSLINGEKSCVDEKSISTKRIEVCMGNKCKKAGSAALLEEFERAVGEDGAAIVVGCKCMGKCRDGPNVRVMSSVNGIQSVGMDDCSVRREASSNPLCIGVGLDDVGVIVSNFLGEERKACDLAPAS